MSETNYAAIAAALTGGHPLALAIHDDGSLVVVAHTGQKFTFSKEQVEIKAAELMPTKPPKQSPAEKPKPSPKPTPAQTKPPAKSAAKK